MASAANRGGTRTIAVLAPVASAASSTVLKTGMPSTSRPPLPGVTPETTCVPYERLLRVWKPVAILCLGHVAEFYPKPMLELEGWAQRGTLGDFVTLDRW